MLAKPAPRVFKTAKFGKSARKAGIGDQELCAAIRQVMAGQVDDLGGGVFKKRLNDNMHCSIVLAKGGRQWGSSICMRRRTATTSRPMS